MRNIKVRIKFPEKMPDSWLPMKSWRQLGPEGDTGAGGLTRKNPGDRNFGLHNVTYEIWIFDVMEIIHFFNLIVP